MMEKKKPNPIDVHVGSRIRLRRTMLKISQEKLADGLGITFQQVQKYEKGANRVGASRLLHIATILNVPVAHFFADAPDTSVSGNGKSFVQEEDAVTSFLATREGMELNLAFQKVANPKLRQNIVQLVKSLRRPSDLDRDHADPGATR
ncbi:helix-turn-helix domain-containing protein [Neorhizobium galegae]|uniref:helix-turn-helix domain-containing protein n=2 Tax=Neorhizobium galegae TaxID=399 RepID=UPI000622657D|nr:helix-turn-helix transcriptional regulator [Neorhizobium galegae]CDZ29930.1 Putative HTH-type transcriptional regulator R00410 [Neorhizobium galegae bv. officinalis]KAA9383791.1 helix-turn-helix transcriptional regulator [Neorhizobium galegae]MCM2500075.1 helix-turn-helix transcriptional regulator [Neorhizobium galegae]MCQ1768158.1 helix-turn-helix transcriptional regulator [Neorhizobium galegae]MCQ1775267.1 helix-turn-helix transcriptional regulator [Neorhizobium galegae]